MHELLEWIAAGRHLTFDSGMSRQSRKSLTSNDGKSQPERSLSPSSKLQDRLWRACRNDPKGVKDALAKGAVLSWRNRSGSSYLHRAAQCGNISIVTLLLDADPSLVSTTENVALVLSIASAKVFQLEQLKHFDYDSKLSESYVQLGVDEYPGLTFLMNVAQGNMRGWDVKGSDGIISSK